MDSDRITIQRVGESHWTIVFPVGDTYTPRDGASRAHLDISKEEMDRLSVAMGQELQDADIGQCYTSGCTNVPRDVDALHCEQCKEEGLNL